MRTSSSSACAVAVAAVATIPLAASAAPAKKQSAPAPSHLDGTSRVFFESCDCSGAPLIGAEPTGQFGALFTPSAIAASHKLYLATQSAESATRKTVCSLLTTDAGCEPVGDSGEASEQSVVPAERVGQLPFQEPYHVEGSGLSDPLAAP